MVVGFVSYLSTRNFTCLRETNLLFISSTLNRCWGNLTFWRFFLNGWDKMANRRNGDPHRHIAGTYQHVMTKHCGTDYTIKKLYLKS